MSKNLSLENYFNICQDYDGILYAFAKACRLSPAECAVLFAITEGCDTQSEICEELFMMKQTVHSAVKKLITNGLITLVSQENDLRIKKISLTDTGKSFVKENVDVFKAAEQNVWNAMTSEEREAIIKVSQKYNQLLKTELQPFFSKRSKRP